MSTQMEHDPRISNLKLLDVYELAELWRVSPHTIRLWVRQGRIHATKICRRVLFHPDECARFIEDNK